MSMMCSIIALSAKQIAAFRARPSLACGFAQVAVWDASDRRSKAWLERLPAAERQQYEAARRDLKHPDLEKKRALLAPSLSGLGPFEGILDVGQDWHILHYLFTGHSDGSSAPGDALLSGEAIGEDVSGYGPARLHDVEDARAFRDFLTPLSSDVLIRRMDFAEMARLNIYPIVGVVDAEDAQDWRNEITEIFPVLKAYVQGAAEKNEGLLTWIY